MYLGNSSEAWGKTPRMEEINPVHEVSDFAQLIFDA
jgi:hypothetical protein